MININTLAILTAYIYVPELCQNFPIIKMPKNRSRARENADSAPITVTKKERPDDLSSIVKDVACGIDYKLIGLLFLIFLFVTSDVFMIRVLDKFDDAVDYKSPTNKGILIQGVFVVIFYIIADALIKNSVI